MPLYVAVRGKGNIRMSTFDPNEPHICLHIFLLRSDGMKASFRSAPR